MFRARIGVAKTRVWVADTDLVYKKEGPLSVPGLNLWDRVRGIFGTYIRQLLCGVIKRILII